MAGENLREGLLLGMGNPLLDISAAVDSEFLKKYDLKPNDAILAEDSHKPLYDELIKKYNADYIAGGSVQNALRCAQWLLEKPRVTTFFGCVGKDDYAKILESKARENGVNAIYQYHEEEPTGTCAVLITGTHRSLCANLAAANHFTVDHIMKPENKKLIEAAQYFYISGFFLTVSLPSIMEVAKYVLAHDRILLMNLSASFISQCYFKQFMQVMPYVDVIFGNEDEAEAFAAELGFKSTDRKEIAKKICDLSKQNEKRSRICIITQGTEPVIVARDGEIQEFPVDKLPKEALVDTNGAGDAFVGGFLSQYIQGQPLEVCIKASIWTASQIVQTSGCTYEGKATFRP